MHETNGSAGAWVRPEDQEATGLLARPADRGDIDYEEDETEPPPPPPPPPDYPGGGDDVDVPSPTRNGR